MLSAQRSATSGYRRLWRERPFLLFLGGGAISTLGNHFLAVAVSWALYVRTGSSLQVAGVSVAFQIPYVLVGPAAGVFADRWDRRRTMLVCDGIRALIVTLLALATWQWGLSFGLALVSVLLLETVGQFFGPSRRAFLPQIVDTDDLVDANGILTGTRQAIGLGGGALAGVVVSAFGAVVALLIDAFSFLMSALSLLLLRSPEKPEEPLAADPSSVSTPIPRGRWQRFWAEMHEGARVVVQQPILRTLLLFTIVVNAAYAMIEPILPAYVFHQLRAGAWALGGIESLQFAGALAGGVMAGTLTKRLRVGHILIWSMLILALGLMAVSLLHNIPLAFGAWMLTGLSMALSGVVEQSLFQTLIPREYMGRASSLMYALSMGFMPMGPSSEDISPT